MLFLPSLKIAVRRVWGCPLFDFLAPINQYFSTYTICGWPVANIVYLVVLCLVVALGGMTGMAAGTWFERRFIALLQVRKGPNRVGPLGLFQPIADGIKTFFKEDLIPATADKALNRLAPGIALFAALMGLAVLPFGPAIAIEGWGTLTLYVSDLNVGVLFLLGVGSLHVYGVILAGWSSGNKYSLLGALRGAAQLVSYEIVLGMSLVGVVMIGVDGGSFWGQMQDGVDVWSDVDNGFIKTVVFGFTVSFIALRQGFEAQATPEGVARATTRTVVMASLSVLALDFVLTALMFKL